MEGWEEGGVDEKKGIGREEDYVEELGWVFGEDACLEGLSGGFGEGHIHSAFGFMAE